MGRTNEEHLIGLDLGTSMVRCAVACCRPNGELILEGYAEVPSVGIVKGLIVDAAQASECVHTAIDDAAARAGVDVLSVLPAVATPYARGLNSRGCIGITHEDKVVRGADARHALAAARRISLPSDRVVAEVYTQGFAVDDARGIHNPVGLVGARLEAEVHIVTDSLSAQRNAEQVARQAGYACERVVFGPMAAAEAALTAEEKRLGAVHIHVGAGTTAIALYCGGYPRFSRVLPIGCQHITNDLAIGLNTSVAEAERLKREHGIPSSRRPRRGAERARIEVPLADGSGTQTYPLWRAGLIVQARVEEIFELALRELGRSGYAWGATAGWRAPWRWPSGRCGAPSASDAWRSTPRSASSRPIPATPSSSAPYCGAAPTASWRSTAASRTRGCGGCSPGSRAGSRRLPIPECRLRRKPDEPR